MQTENRSRAAVRATALLFASLAVWVLASMRADGAVVTFTNNTLIAATNLTYDGQDIIVNACTITTRGSHAFNSVLLTNTGTLSIAGGTTLSVADHLRLTTTSTLICQGANTGGQVSNQWAGVGVTILANNVTVEASSAISADGQGYTISAGGGGGGGVGPGGGGTGSYGGHGTGSSGPTYGDATHPIDLGSSGSVGGFGGSSSGGGAIALEVMNSLQLDGSITANGQSGAAQGFGAAGGSVYITTGSLTGSGTITANANNGFNGQPGGGGRIAVYFANASGYTGFTNCTANGAENGTVGFFDTSVPNLQLRVYRDFRFAPGSVLHFGGMTLDNAGTIVVGGGSALQVDGSLVLRSNSTLLLQGKNVSGQVNGQWAGAGVTIAASNAMVAAGSTVSADGQGYTISAGNGGGGGVGPGGGGTGSYGGHGTGSSGPTYGDATHPIDLGSSGSVGGFGGSSIGGGVITIEVGNSLQLDGSITANGQSSGQGFGAAGGSVSITTGSLTGSGAITANANNGFNGQPGGGGGRIAVYFANASGYTGFTNCTANGAENGTVGFFDTSVPNMQLNVYQNFRFGPDSVPHVGGMTVDNAATVVLGGGSALHVDGVLAVRNNSTLLLQGKNVSGQVNGEWAGAGVTIVSSNVTVEAGSAISADGQGYTISAGGGGSGPMGPGGGNTGSYGGRGSGNGGPTYGDATFPIDLGSTGNVGGFGGSSSGGGAIALEIMNSLVLDGNITANAQSSGNGAGAAGGSVFIATGSLTGSGTISANGNLGFANSDGGGGRVTVYLYSSNNPTNQITASAGGDGAKSGSVLIAHNQSIVRLQKTNDSFSLEWVTFPPHVYQLQHTTNLVPIQWINVGGPITPTNYTTTVSDAVGTDSQRFYRNTLLP